MAIAESKEELCRRRACFFCLMTSPGTRKMQASVSAKQEDSSIEPGELELDILFRASYEKKKTAAFGADTTMAAERPEYIRLNAPEE